MRCRFWPTKQVSLSKFETQFLANDCFFRCLNTFRKWHYVQVPNDTNQGLNCGAMLLRTEWKSVNELHVELEYIRGNLEQFLQARVPGTKCQTAERYNRLGAGGA